MTTKTTKVARKIMSKGRGHVLYNDKLKGGRRSLKVIGWNKGDYLKAKRKLEKMGYVVDLVEFDAPTYLGYCATQLRLHVTE
jgi:hypothetical protein